MFEFMTEHAAEFTALASALMVAGGIIVKLTPTKTDDKWWRGLMSMIGRGEK